MTLSYYFIFHAYRHVNLWLFFLIALLYTEQSHSFHSSGVGSFNHPGWACLRRTDPSIQLKYPEDAEEHFAEIHHVMGNWTQPPGHQFHGYAHFHGPWVENLWITRAKELNATRFTGSRWRRKKPKPLSTVFGPFIPLLFTWVDTWIAHEWQYPPDFISLLMSVLRPTVPYATVSQSDEGLTGHCQLLMKDVPNVLVFSAGGYGHVPIPLFMKEQPVCNSRPMAQRTHLISYVGSLGNAPNEMRGRMKDTVGEQSAILNFSYAVYRGPGWLEIMADSQASLVPRGFGRTAFHLVEVIQMGLIPVYVYSDVPWLPYPHIYTQFGFTANLTTLPEVLTTLKNMPPSDLAKREELVLRHRHLFLPNEVLDQIFMFIANGSSELRCELLPESPRGLEPCKS